MTTENLETVATHNWVVALRTPGGYKRPLQRVVVVEAHSAAEAKKKAIQKVAVGKWQHVRPSMWIFTEVTDANAQEEVNESGNSSGTE